MTLTSHTLTSAYKGYDATMSKSCLACEHKGRSTRFNGTLMETPITKFYSTRIAACCKDITADSTGHAKQLHRQRVMQL